MVVLLAPKKLYVDAQRPSILVLPIDSSAFWLLLCGVPCCSWCKLEWHGAPADIWYASYLWLWRRAWGQSDLREYVQESDIDMPASAC